jgi:TetR/AcrR family transcriptional regulator, transcriptional repressor for nem operon
MSKAEKTREYIIEKAAPIFNMKGYAGTSLTDLIEATGLTKGAIYGNFESKDEVAVAVYEYSIKMLYGRLNDAIATQQTAAGKLKAITNYYRTNWKNIFARGGCPIMNASVEADDNLPFLKKQVQTSMKNWAGMISSVIENGQRTREFKKDIDATAYAYTIITLLEGGIMLAKLNNTCNHLFAAIDRAERIIKEEIEV